MSTSNTVSIPFGNAAILDTEASESSRSAVSWSAIFSGALAAVAVSIILLILGSALGLSAASHWSRTDMSVAGFTAKTVIWLVVVQWIASGMGGFFTGRLRTKWANVHADEVFFRDTVHGFLAWALATVLTVSVIASGASMLINTGVQAGAVVSADAVAGQPANEPKGITTDMDPTGYYVDTLFRSDAARTTSEDVRAETMRIFATDLKTTDATVSEVDKVYLTRLVAARTGLGQTEASRRVDDTLAQLTAAKAKMLQEAEIARKTGMKFALYTFLAMLVGAFIASAAGALGGRHRDEFNT